MPAPTPIWSATKEAIESHPLKAFMRLAKQRFGLNLQTYEDVHDFSTSDYQRFWQLVWEFTQIQGQKFDKVSNRRTFLSISALADYASAASAPLSLALLGHLRCQRPAC